MIAHKFGLCTKIEDFWHPRNPTDFYDIQASVKS